MADRKLDVKLISAKDLKKVNKSKMHVYVVAWVDPIVRVHGPVDKTNGCNPVWDETTITVTLEARALAANMKLNIELVGQGFLSTKPIGYVVIDLTELMQEGATGAAATAQFLAHEVTLPTGELQGNISFELHLQECPSMLAAQAAQAAQEPNQETAQKSAQETSQETAQEITPA
ncbi:hypothetical protein M758_9G020100 [Ceratodon purpureus]|nr:hypothetical protein M758_9G020100 [Ceratodon purpureus]